MEIAQINNGVIIQIGHYKQMFPNVSFPSTGPDEIFMQENSLVGVTVWKQHDRATQKLISVAPYIEDNQVFTVEVIDKTDEDINLESLDLSNEIRVKRNDLLIASDWTQVADAPVDKTAWATYRQELRDITSQEEFPFTIIWPNTPE